MYIIWQDYGGDGWRPSDEFKTLDDAIKYAIEECMYSSNVKITKVVEYQVIEKE